MSDSNNNSLVLAEPHDVENDTDEIKTRKAKARGISFVLAKAKGELGLARNPWVPADNRLTQRQRRMLELGSITNMLNEMPGGRSQVVKMLAYSAKILKDEHMSEILDLYLRLPKRDREKVSYEALCDATNTPWEHFLGQITAACYHHHHNLSSLILQSSHIEVLEKTIEFAKSPRGTKDREMLHKMAGVLDSAPNINITNTVTGAQTIIQEGSGLNAFEKSVMSSVSASRDNIIDAEVIEVSETNDVQHEDS